MNELLQLRWMIAMLEAQRPAGPMASAELASGQLDASTTNNHRRALLDDLRTELAVQQRFHDEALADGARQAQIDRDK